MRARKSDQVLEAARRVFLERGFDAATVEEVALDAGVSKATVYSNFRDKHALLEAMIDRVTAESRAILSTAVQPLDEGGPLKERFTRVGIALVRGVLRPEVIQLRRLALSTAVEFPDSASLYWQRGPGATIEMLSGRLEAMNAAGEIACRHPGGTAALFAYALIGPLQDRMLFEPTHAASDDDVTDHIERAVDMLLAAIRVPRRSAGS